MRISVGTSMEFFMGILMEMLMKTSSMGISMEVFMGIWIGILMRYFFFF